MAHISRLQAERELQERRANEVWESGDTDTPLEIYKAIKFLNSRIKWHREQMRNA